MADHDLLFEALAEFARTLVGRYAIADVLTQLTDQVVVALGLDGAGVSVGDEKGLLRFVTASTDDLIVVERAQEEYQEGPCVSAFHTGDIVTVDELGADDRWPDYRPIALRAGYHAVAAVPLRAPDNCIGSLNLYSAETRPWQNTDTERALLFADMAASYVSNASDLQRSERVREQLQQALDSRIIIEQAKGTLAARHDITIDEAYQRLRRHTRGQNANLHDIANAIVNQGLQIP